LTQPPPLTGRGLFLIFFKIPKIRHFTRFFFFDLFQDVPMNETNGGKETYLTIEEAAAYLKLARQTIRKWVLNQTIPYRKVQKSVRFRLSEIEKWIDEGGKKSPEYPVNDRQGDLFADMSCPPAADNGKAGGTGAEEEEEQA
jgi:excisionase family DNA binding protein